MRFDERYPEFNPCKERPAPPAAENVIRVAPEEYRKLVRDSVFARNFAELAAEEIRHIAERGYGSSDVSTAMRVMLRLYDPELYENAWNSEAEKRSETDRDDKPLSEYIKTYMDEHGTEVE